MLTLETFALGTETQCIFHALMQHVRAFGH